MLLGTRTQLLASAAAGFAVCTPAYAQDAPTSAQTTVSQATNVAPTNQSVTDDNSQAIIVTAQKRDSPARRSASVTVVGGDTLERQQATNFQDYLGAGPGLSLNGSTAGVTRSPCAASTPAASPRRSRSSWTTCRSDRAPAWPTARSFRATSIRSISTASKCCAARRAPFTAPARSAAFFSSSPTRRN